MESSHAHQLILPTDKRNPCFSLYLSEDERSIHLFYGLEVLQRVLLGRGASRKRTPAIDRYVIRHRTELLDEGCPNYRATLMGEIETFFDLRLSGETIRQIIRTREPGKSPASDDTEPPGDPDFDPIIPFLEETTC